MEGSGETILEAPCTVSKKLEEIMLPTAAEKVSQLKTKLQEINSDVSKLCLRYLDTCDKPRMVDLMTICHILNKEQLYILEDEEDINVEDLFINMEQYLTLGTS